ncbi:calcium-binding protein [Phyllobacterium sp. CCNWLW109]|uniref:calcium-binding protein n=1 Tax=Phyllobacterium sp. CCNWLW109 TaxID=3127479 RepID=UPI0030774420
MADIRLTEGADSWIGTGADETVFGLGGDDTIHGNGGNDTIYGGDGKDQMDGDEGDDTFYGGDDHDAFYGHTGNDVFYGDEGDDGVWAGSGNDTIYGGVGEDGLYGDEGDDTIDGGAGEDKLYGGAGNDTFYVDNAGDQIIEANATGIDRVLSLVSFAAGAQHIENITLTGAANINATGNALANILTGNAGNNALDGGAGADSMSGGAGADKYYVDNVNDRVYEGNVAGVDVVSSSVSFAMGGQHIENILLTGSASVNATGNALNNYLVGNSGANIISGGTGNDLLTGGGGRDAFVFNTAPNSTTNRDTITDFNVAADTVWMDNAAFAVLGANGTLAAGAFHIGAGAADASDRIIYNSSSGALYYDADGSGSGAAVQFATLGNGLALTNADFLVI